MTAVRIVYIYCDYCESEEPADVAPAPEWTAYTQRNILREQGWDRPRGKYDRCPDCKAERRTVAKH